MATVTQEQTTVNEKKAGRPEQPVYPGIENGAVLDAVPEDYDYKKFKALSKDNFKTPDLYHDWKATVCDQKTGIIGKQIAKLQGKMRTVEADAKEHREFAEHFRKTGEFPVSKRAKKKTALKGVSAVRELIAQLKEMGEDTSEYDGLNLDAVENSIEKM